MTHLRIKGIQRRGFADGCVYEIKSIKRKPQTYLKLVKDETNNPVNPFY